MAQIRVVNPDRTRSLQFFCFPNFLCIPHYSPGPLFAKQGYPIYISPLP
jgi:hypothetical protein